MAKRILVVDDSPSMRQVQRPVLSSVSHDVLEVSGGKDDLTRLKEAPVNRTFTDMNMPNLDGMALIGALRAHPAHLTPVVLVTTESAEEKKREAKLAGATGWVVKPFIPNQPLTVVVALLGKGAA